jgi:hypothetical protein
MQTAASPSAPADDGSVEQVYSTNEGPVVITTRGKLVFVSESFPLPLARKLTTLILDAQGGGAMRMAETPRTALPSGQSTAHPPDELGSALSADLVHFFESCGVMRAAADPLVKAGR